MTTTQAVLDDRYGRRGSPRRRRAIWIAVIAVAAIVVGAFAWSTIANPANALKAVDTGYRIEERSVTLSFTLSAPAGTSVACALEAMDEEYGVVGWKVVELPASDSHVRTFTETVPTVAKAATGLVNACWVA